MQRLIYNIDSLASLTYFLTSLIGGYFYCIGEYRIVTLLELVLELRGL